VRHWYFQRHIEQQHEQTPPTYLEGTRTLKSTYPFPLTVAQFLTSLLSRQSTVGSQTQSIHQFHIKDGVNLKTSAVDPLLSIVYACIWIKMKVLYDIKN